MSDNFTEMISFLENVAKVNRVVTLPSLEKKTGLKIIDKGQDHGMIVTEADKNISLYLLDGGIEGIQGIRQKYPGSFSEEDDSPERLNALSIFQIDPIDGIRDMTDTYKSSKVVGPTTLVSKLERKAIQDSFIPVSGLIFDILNGIALISDSKNIGLYKVKDNSIKEIAYEKTEHPWKEGDAIKINFNEWVQSRTYRDNLVRLVSQGVENPDIGLDEVPEFGKGSSFDGLVYQSRGQEMQVGDRWQAFTGDPEYKALFEDPEIFSLSEQIFGHIKGTEVLYSMDPNLEASNVPPAKERAY